MTGEAAPLCKDGERTRGEGGYVSQPKEVDAEVCRAWAKIYEGNGGRGTEAHAKEFTKKYYEYLCKEGHRECEPATEGNVKVACRSTKRTAAGTVGCDPGELAGFSDGARAYVGVLYNMVEAWACWPEGSHKASAGFFEKDTKKQGQIMNYQLLLMLPAFYPKWASVRLGTM